MAAKKTTTDAKKPAPNVSRVTNHSTVDLTIKKVLIKANGGHEDVKEFDPKNAMYAAFIEAKMISVE